jgi:outer membrane biosynthesis protein TonB
MLDIKSGKDRQKYLASCFKKIQNLDDDNWKRLSPAAQKWYNAADEVVEAADKAEEGPEFEDFADAASSEDEDEDEQEEEQEEEEQEEVEASEAEDEAEEEEETPKAGARKVKSATKTKAKPEIKAKAKAKAKSKPEVKAKAAKSNGHARPKPAAKRGESEGVVVLVHEAIIDNPQITKGEMMEHLSKRGNTASSMTVGTHMSIARSVLRRLKRRGNLKGINIE